jgi:hypothetical protein
MSHYSLPPDGWVLDSADPSVGIFGTAFIHDACPKWDEDRSVIGDDEMVQIGVKYMPKSWGNEIELRFRVTCKACGATSDWYSYDYSPNEEELERYS